MKKVVLVDNQDHDIGTSEVVQAHRGNGTLHRAVSAIVFRIIDGDTEILLQQRSNRKLLFPGYWANTVCTHPAPGEIPLDAALRRLKEELGITAAVGDFIPLGIFIYQAEYSNKYAENELDHVFAVSWNGTPSVNRQEVQSVRWISYRQFSDGLPNGSAYAPWVYHMFSQNSVRNFFAPEDKS